MNISRILNARAAAVLKPKKLALTRTWPAAQFMSTVSADEEIKIPNRIPRGPTDILRALEGTISRDPTAAHYKYHDDPYLIPMSNAGKRTFAMSQEAGRKAAQWVKREHADLFNHMEMDPPVEAFLPPVVFNENSAVDEQNLLDLVKKVQVEDAKFVYNLLKERNVEVSKEAQQALLELLCFQNSEDALAEDFIEERWFTQQNRAKEKLRKTWKDGDLAEELFVSLDIPTPASYSALIQGMARYYQIDRAYQLFEEAQQKGIIVNTGAYNSMLSSASFLKENYELRWSFIVDLLSQMQASKLRPNLETLNAVLYTLSTMGGSRVTKKTCLSVLAEFRAMGIEPSLGSWHYILTTYCREKGHTSTVLYDIMNELENKEHKIRHIRDTSFFVTAMDVCRNHLKDVVLARRVHQLLNHGNNYDLIGDSYKESVYFRHYCALMCSHLPFKDFLEEVYEPLVPHVYVPEPGIMAEILKQADLQVATEHVPRLWSDIIIFDQAQREALIDIVLSIMVNHQPLPESELNERFAVIAWDIFRRTENQPEYKTNKLSLTGDFLGRIMILLLRNKDFSKACNIMDKLDKEADTVVGVPKFEALALFVDQCVEEKLPSRAIDCIAYCSECGFPEANTMAAMLCKKLTLDEVLRARLSKIVGDLPLPEAEEVPEPQ